MKVLVVGGGGREHALAWKLAQSPKVKMVFVAPGNGGTAWNGRIQNLAIVDLKPLRAWAAQEKIALTVVGPEGPLAHGIVDEFRANLDKYNNKREWLQANRRRSDKEVFALFGQPGRVHLQTSLP